MKRIISIAAVSALSLSVFSSCTFIKVDRGLFEGMTSGIVTPSKETKTVTYDLPQFIGIESSVAADIVYTHVRREAVVGQSDHNGSVRDPQSSQYPRCG